jgi:hypothetical protein
MMIIWSLWFLSSITKNLTYMELVIRCPGKKKSDDFVL